MGSDREREATAELPTVAEIHAIHEKVVDRYDLTHDGMQAHFPDRRIQSVIDEASQHDDPHRRAAELLWHLIARHVYEDGNKRTAWLATANYLEREGFELPVDLDEVATVLKHRGRYDTEEFTVWLKSGEIDRSKLRDS